MFTRFYGSEYANLAQQFACALEGYSVSTAQLQGHFVVHKRGAQAAVDHASALIDPHTPQTNN
ncbi:hypothetical protein GGI06_005025 [Coemansia sp. S85]|nr:hypothetical protein GGI06_005025 [Coemansia sp. S85]